MLFDVMMPLKLIKILDSAMSDFVYVYNCLTNSILNTKHSYAQLFTVIILM